MNTRYISALVCTILLPAVCVAQPRFTRTSVKPLKPLNPAIFGTNKLGASLQQKTLAQLLRAKELQALSSEQRSLLLTHKFVEENHKLPRTLIFVDGKVLPPAQYTPEQKLETSLGGGFKRILEDRNKNISSEIRQEAIQLQRDFSLKYHSARVVDNLNEWLLTHETWPREKITHRGTLTEAELYEMALAQDINRILSEDTTLPKELKEQIRLTRSLYDERYAPVEPKEPYQPVRRDIWPPIICDVEYPSRPYDFYYTQQPRDSFSLKRQEVFEQTPQPVEPDPFLRPEDISYEKDLEAFHYTITGIINGKIGPTAVGWSNQLEAFAHLRNWLHDTQTWPKIIGEEELASATLRQKQGHYLATQVQQLRKVDPLNDKKLAKWYKEWFPAPNSWTLATMDAPQQLYQKLQDWIQANGRWPHTYILDKKHVRLPESLTQQNEEEIQLARQVEAFAKLAHPAIRGRWRKTTRPSGLLILRYTSKYNNPELEQFRKLYQEWNNVQKDQ